MKFDRITCNPNRMNGQPCIRDLRLTVRCVVWLSQIYPDRQELKAEYPELEREDIQQALAFSKLNGIEVDLDDTPKEMVLKDLRQGLEDTLAGRTFPIAELWDGIDAE